jgi:hypothetical protein
LIAQQWSGTAAGRMIQFQVLDLTVVSVAVRT